jgi:hypothetical protein
MAVSVRGQPKAPTAKDSKRQKTSKSVSSTDHENNEVLADEHLPPLFLVAVVLMCSGPLFVLAMRDFFSTGKVIAGSWDKAILVSFCLAYLTLLIWEL